MLGTIAAFAIVLACCCLVWPIFMAWRYGFQVPDISYDGRLSRLAETDTLVSITKNPEHWCNGAQELRAEADGMREGPEKQAILVLAETYARLGSEAEQQRLREQQHPSPPLVPGVIAQEGAGALADPYKDSRSI